ncbi:uncharacterized protein LOC143292219 [Babylonia areolata]|uniref:uncharacterized protein LOC143292219 n=1 Tax=Babylonia areolata TaxID=304850 RepID=UPI003FD6BB3E
MSPYEAARSARTPATITTTSTKQQHSALPSSESDEVVYHTNGLVRQRGAEWTAVEEEGGGGGGGGSGDAFLFNRHHPHHHHHHHHHPPHPLHPYERILQRLVRRHRQVNTELHPYTSTKPEPPHSHAPSNTQTIPRTSHRISSLHPARLSPRTDDDRQTSRPRFRWQGSKSVRRSPKADTTPPQRKTPRWEKRPKVDLSGGFLTGRNPAGPAEGDGGEEDAHPELLLLLPDTTRSEPGDESRAGRELRSQLLLPQVAERPPDRKQRRRGYCGRPPGLLLGVPGHEPAGAQPGPSPGRVGRLQEGVRQEAVASLQTAALSRHPPSPPPPPRLRNTPSPSQGISAFHHLAQGVEVRVLKRPLVRGGWPSLSPGAAAPSGSLPSSPGVVPETSSMCRVPAPWV